MSVTQPSKPFRPQSDIGIPISGLVEPGAVEAPSELLTGIAELRSFSVANGNWNPKTAAAFATTASKEHARIELA